MSSAEEEAKDVYGKKRFEACPARGRGVCRVCVDQARELVVRRRAV